MNCMGWTWSPAITILTSPCAILSYTVAWRSPATVPLYGCRLPLLRFVYPEWASDSETSTWFRCCTWRTHRSFTSCDTTTRKSAYGCNSVCRKPWIALTLANCKTSFLDSCISVASCSRVDSGSELALSRSFPTVSYDNNIGTTQ